MGGGGQLGVGEFGESAGEGGFGRKLAGVIPAAQLAEAMVGSKGFAELSGVHQTVDTFGEEGADDGGAVFAGTSPPAALEEERANGDHGADSDEESGAVADGADSGGKEREELLLEDVGELGELFGKGELHGNKGAKRANQHRFTGPLYRT